MNMGRRTSFIREAGWERVNRLLLSATFIACLAATHFCWSAETNAPASSDKAADLLRSYRSDIVLIKGKVGAGSGFVFKRGDRKFLASNAHVMASVRAPTITALDRTPIKFKPGAAMVAVGHDIILLEVQEAGNGMPLVESVENEVAVNDLIAVCGNSGGGDVVTLIKGKVVGIGPDRIEIDAEFERGNSGSPIIHLPSGKVIGVAAYAIREELISGDKKIRRFGYRFDTVKQWQPVDWGRFYSEADKLEKIELTTTELAQAFLELNGLNQRTKKVRKYAYELPTIRNALDSYYDSLDTTTTEREAHRVVNSLLGSLRGASQSDIAPVKPNFTYDYFRRQFTEQESYRTEIMDLIVKVMKN